MNFDMDSDLSVEQLIADEERMTRVRVNATTALRRLIGKNPFHKGRYTPQMEAALFTLLNDLRGVYEVEERGLPDLSRALLTEDGQRLDLLQMRAILDALGEAFAKEAGLQGESAALWRAGFVAGLTVALSHLPRTTS